MTIKECLDLEIEVDQRMEEMINGLQQLLWRKKLCFFADINEEEFKNLHSGIMASMNGWIVPLELANEYCGMTKESKKEKGFEYYQTVKVFRDFEGSNKWLYNIEGLS